MNNLGLYLVLAALPLAACAGKKLPPAISEGQCLGYADGLKTLRKGDPLPRVKEVMGPPSRSYRTTTTFGGRYDVLEYDTGDTPCTRYVLDAPRKLVLLFNAQGQLTNHGNAPFTPLRGATSNRIKAGTF
jgi:hypothetical protein